MTSNREKGFTPKPTVGKNGPINLRKRKHSKARSWWGIRRIINPETSERLAQRGDTLVQIAKDKDQVQYLQINHAKGRKTLVRRFAKKNRLKRVGL